MARDDAAARGLAPVRAEMTKAPPATVDSDSEHSRGHRDPGFRQCGTWCAHLVVAQGSGRLSALTVHQPTPASSYDACFLQQDFFSVQCLHGFRQVVTPASPSCFSSRRFPCGRRSTRTRFNPLAPVTLTPPPAPVGRRDRGLCLRPQLRPHL